MFISSYCNQKNTINQFLQSKNCILFWYLENFILLKMELSPAKTILEMRQQGSDICSYHPQQKIDKIAICPKIKKIDLICSLCRQEILEQQFSKEWIFQGIPQFFDEQFTKLGQNKENKIANTTQMKEIQQLLIKIKNLQKFLESIEQLLLNRVNQSQQDKFESQIKDLVNQPNGFDFQSQFRKISEKFDFKEMNFNYEMDVDLLPAVNKLLEPIQQIQERTCKIQENDFNSLEKEILYQYNIRSDFTMQSTLEQCRNNLNNIHQIQSECHGLKGVIEKKANLPGQTGEKLHHIETRVNQYERQYDEIQWLHHEWLSKEHDRWKRWDTCLELFEGTKWTNNDIIRVKEILLNYKLEFEVYGFDSKHNVEIEAIIKKYFQNTNNYHCNQQKHQYYWTRIKKVWINSDQQGKYPGVTFEIHDGSQRDFGYFFKHATRYQFGLQYEQERSDYGYNKFGDDGVFEYFGFRKHEQDFSCDDCWQKTMDQIIKPLKKLMK